MLLIVAGGSTNTTIDFAMLIVSIDLLAVGGLFGLLLVFSSEWRMRRHR